MTDEVLTRLHGGVGVILLNRPKAINALNASMCLAVLKTLQEWRDNDAVARILLQSTTPRGLCSGGDVRAVREVAMAGDMTDPAHLDRAMEFWHAEYDMDAALESYPKPITVIMEGIVMGGGVGLAAYASQRVVTESTQLAMPETAIGYFPDVAATWLLARTPGQLGVHMAMTGDTFSGADAIAAGFADIFVPNERLHEVTALDETPGGSIPAADPPPSALLADQEWIDQCYAGDDPVVILHRLEHHENERAREAAELIRRRSPLSVALALATVRQAAGIPTPQETLERDQRLNRRMLQRSDFFEGVRDVLVDKGKGDEPRWLYPTLEDVPPELVAQMLG